MLKIINVVIATMQPHPYVVGHTCMVTFRRPTILFLIKLTCNKQSDLEQ